jgi:cytochrome P450
MTDFSRDYGTDYDLDDPELSARWDEVIPDLHDRCPVARSEVGTGYWVINSYQDVVQCAKDWQTFSSADGFQINRPDGLPLFFPAEADPPLQKVLRETLDPFLSPRVMPTLEAKVRAYADQLIDSFIETGEVEVVRQFAEPVPQYVFSTLIAGMDPADMPYLLTCFDFNLPGEQRAQGFANGFVHVEGYLRQRQQEPPRGDIVDALLAIDFPGYEWENKVGTMCQLTVGGVGTTGFAFSGGLHHLATHPDQLKILVEDRSRLTKAVEEFLRHYTGVPNMARHVRQDTEVGGQKIAAGEWLLLSFGAASRDPAVCERPNEVDITRRSVKHLAFGSGVHRCIGQPLARMAINIGYDQFLTRIPEFSVAEGFTPEYVTGLTRHMVRLPLTFAPGQRTQAAAYSEASA